MQTPLTSLPLDRVHLLPGIYQQRRALARAYLMELKNENLLQNYYLEARLWQARLRITPRDERGDTTRPVSPDELHWGWESPTVQLRGHFLGHWLSAAACLAGQGDLEAKAKADVIVSELARCQAANGGEWVGPIPESYLHWTAKGCPTWAPQYVVHKLIMGLLDMVKFAGNQQALDILLRLADWFFRWTGQFSRAQMDDLLEVETGGMLEAWADLYAITGAGQHLELMRRYDRPRLFEPLLAGEDVLTNRHANTTIPEAHGAARAYEVTGEQRWRNIAEAYWRCAVTERGAFCTGGQSSGEVWTPPFQFAARLGPKTQEHCTVYNLIRLADTLLRWTGKPVYADYIERNLVNGVLAQQNRETGLVAYFLPLNPGAHKIWGSRTDDFWCCHGTTLQAHSRVQTWTWYAREDGFTVAQYIPSQMDGEIGGVPVQMRQTLDRRAGETHRPGGVAVDLAVSCGQPLDFALDLRIPDWVAGPAEIRLNGETLEAGAPGSFVRLRRTWEQDTLHLDLPSALTCSPIPDEPERVAFLDGPVVLAGLTDADTALVGDPNNPETILAPDNEREWMEWLPGYRTVHQNHNFRFIPLHDITDERYTVYFETKKPG